MFKLLIIADDYTGALDTGVKFAQSGINTGIISRTELPSLPENIIPQVLVIDSQTRHSSPAEAYNVVHELTVRMLERYPSILLFKKTDSVLRGNIGSELTAVLDASGKKKLVFAPALPQSNRITVQSTQYADGIPVSDSLFGNDLFNPVSCSYIPDLIAQQSRVATRSIPRDEYDAIHASGSEEILICDAVSDQDLVRILQQAQPDLSAFVLAGCSGFASALAELMGTNRKDLRSPHLGKKLLVICGSTNQVSQQQLTVAQKAGVPRITLPADMLLGSTPSDTVVQEIVTLLQNGNCAIIDANDLFFEEKKQFARNQLLKMPEMGKSIAEHIGAVAKAVCERCPQVMPVFIGGDTLTGFLDKMSVIMVSPITEIMPGSVLSSVQTHDNEFHVISKSGGFGPAEWLIDLLSLCLA